jgi:transposase
MLLLPGAVKVYVAIQPVRLNRSFDGLSNVVREVLSKDPLCGHVFVFMNRRKTMVKLLVWTRGGLTILHKRLERGTFAQVFGHKDARTHVEIDVHELSMLLEGIDLASGRMSKRWAPARHVDRVAKNRSRHDESTCLPELNV